jgi:hypothetical protein
LDKPGERGGTDDVPLDAGLGFRGSGIVGSIHLSRAGNVSREIFEVALGRQDYEFRVPLVDQTLQFLHRNQCVSAGVPLVSRRRGVCARSQKRENGQEGNEGTDEFPVHVETP